MDFSQIFEVDKWIQAYFILKLFDFITGFAKAGMVEGFKSSKLRQGIIYVILEIGTIIFAGILDQLLSLDFLLITTKTLFVFKECLSIEENLKIVGIDIPGTMKDAIHSINPDKENEEEKEE